MLNDILAFASALRDAGGWTACIVVIVLVGFGLYSGRLVFGWQYREKAEDVKRLTIAVEKLVAERERDLRRQVSPRGKG